jgi:hypothetical protein
MGDTSGALLQIITPTPPKIFCIKFFTATNRHKNLQQAETYINLALMDEDIEWLFEPPLIESSPVEPSLFEPSLFEPTRLEPSLFEPPLFQAATRRVAAL